MRKRNISIVCPICGMEDGPAHGDPCQIVTQVCEECREASADYVRSEESRQEIQKQRHLDLFKGGAA